MVNVHESDAAVTQLLSSPISEDGTDAYYTNEQIFSIDPEQLERLQLAALQRRFAELSPKLPALTRLAEQNRISSINSIDEAVPLLFPHTVYKSYPLSLIDNCRFEQLSTWLDDFTTHDLAGLDVSGCQSLDAWLDVIEANTPVRVMATSGTSGKVTLLPKSTLENTYVSSNFAAAYTRFGDEPGMADAFAPEVYHVKPFVRHSRHSTGFIIQAIVDRFAGDEDHVLSLGGEMSTDLLWMTGRMKRAQTNGTVEQLKKTRAWQRLNNSLAEVAAKKTASLEEFFKDVLTRLKGKTVVLQFGINYYAAMVECAEKHDLEVRFAADSLFNSGGGLKGATVTAGQRRKVLQSIPGPINELYGFSEILGGSARSCSAGHYHPPHWVVRFVLDPDTGVPCPRKGIQTGRYAAFDLWAQTYWGGFISGDEVTINWDGGCSCGRTGSYLFADISRYSDKRGGDDKITCQRTAAAVEEMVQYMNSQGD
jgi:hypothetical protein